MNHATVRTALCANALTADSALVCYPYLPLSVVTPCFYVGEVTEDFHQSYGGMERPVFTCRVLVSESDDMAGQKNLDAYLGAGGTKSLMTAIESAPGLGGACSDLIVDRQEGHRYYTVGTATYLGAEWSVRVIGESG